MDGWKGEDRLLICVRKGSNWILRNIKRKSGVCLKKTEVKLTERQQWGKCGDSLSQGMTFIKVMALWERKTTPRATVDSAVLCKSVAAIASCVLIDFHGSHNISTLTMFYRYWTANRWISRLGADFRQTQDFVFCVVSKDEAKFQHPACHSNLSRSKPHPFTKR